MTATKLKTKAKAKAPAETRRLGYARASTYGQKIDAQLAQLRAEGCTRIYREKMGGGGPDRRELLKLRPARPLDLRPFRHPQADHGHGRAILVTGRAVG